ncbi:hypothetical protein L1887_37097 [Cichorium endivia]|nr:hypothetical protein L1887_37097 [Cichorium endivia]
MNPKALRCGGATWVRGLTVTHNAGHNRPPSYFETPPDTFLSRFTLSINYPSLSLLYWCFEIRVWIKRTRKVGSRNPRFDREL